MPCQTMTINMHFMSTKLHHRWYMIIIIVFPPHWIGCDVKTNQRINKHFNFIVCCIDRLKWAICWHFDDDVPMLAYQYGYHSIHFIAANSGDQCQMILSAVFFFICTYIIGFYQWLNWHFIAIWIRHSLLKFLDKMRCVWLIFVQRASMRKKLR